MQYCHSIIHYDACYNALHFMGTVMRCMCDTFEEQDFFAEQSPCMVCFISLRMYTKQDCNGMLVLC